MDTDVLIKYCYTNSIRKWETAGALLKAKRYADCLFFCHVALEFVLKGKVVQASGRMFPITHDLMELAKKAQLRLSAKQRRDIEVINTFNIRARYDDYKLTFFHKATPEFARKYYRITKSMLIWLNRKSNNKR